MAPSYFKHLLKNPLKLYNIFRNVAYENFEINDRKKWFVIQKGSIYILNNRNCLLSWRRQNIFATKPWISMKIVNSIIWFGEYAIDWSKIYCFFHWQEALDFLLILYLINENLTFLWTHLLTGNPHLYVFAKVNRNTFLMTLFWNIILFY